MTGRVSAADVGGWTLQHLYLSLGALALGVFVAVPLGLALERRRRMAEGVIRAVGTTQTIPSITSCYLPCKAGTNRAIIVAYFKLLLSTVPFFKRR